MARFTVQNFATWIERTYLWLTGASQDNPKVDVTFPETQAVSGSVSVSNLPETQPVSGTVNVGNLPATQPVSGTVNVGNLPETQSVSGTVSVSSLPPITGTVSIDSIPHITIDAMPRDAVVTFATGAKTATGVAAEICAGDTPLPNRYAVGVFVEGAGPVFIVPNGGAASTGWQLNTGMSEEWPVGANAALYIITGGSSVAYRVVEKAR